LNDHLVAINIDRNIYWSAAKHGIEFLNYRCMSHFFIFIYGNDGIADIASVLNVVLGETTTAQADLYDSTTIDNFFFGGFNGIRYA
jgi:hypothetical protein